MAADESTCKAFTGLEKQIGEQCKNYFQFHEQGAFGSVPGMYRQSHYDETETTPASLTSGYFRGGIINTIATFEGFITDLLKEASQTIEKYSRDEDEKKNFKKRATILDKRYKNEKNSEILYHVWEEKYTNYLLGILTSDEKQVQVPPSTFTDAMLHPGPIQYDYPVDSRKHTSRVKITHKRNAEMTTEEKRTQRRNQRLRNIVDGDEDESVICVFLRLIYGIRNVMGHGNAKCLDEGVLKGFPDCPAKKCTNNRTQQHIREIMDLVEYVQIYHDKASDNEKAELNGLVLRFPTSNGFQQLKSNHEEKLDESEWEDIKAIVDSYFPNHIPASPEVASPYYAYFHMCRVYYWLKKSKSEMYITYRLLVRANQFILMLAFRIYLATATILIEKYNVPPDVTSDNQGNGFFWGVKVKNDIQRKTKVDDEHIKEMIKQFTEDHQRIVLDVVTDGTTQTPCKPTQCIEDIHTMIASKECLKDIPENKWCISICETKQNDTKIYSHLSILKTGKDEDISKISKTEINLYRSKN